MKELYDLKESLISELGSYARGRLDKNAICEIDMIAHATKNICKIIENCEEEESGYSNRGGNMSRYAMRNMSNERGYSRHPDLRGELDYIMSNTNDSVTRQNIQRLMDRM